MSRSNGVGQNTLSVRIWGGTFSLNENGFFSNAAAKVVQRSARWYRWLLADTAALVVSNRTKSKWHAGRAPCDGAAACIEVPPD